MWKMLFFPAITLVFLSFSPIHADPYDDGDGSAEHPFEIRTPEQLNAIGLNSGDWDKHFILTDDINMSAYTGTQYNIIGDDTTQFTGFFDGANHVISNLSYTTTSIVNNVGLFGKTNNATINNLGIENVNITSNCIFSGGIVASLISSMVSNCYCTGSITSSYPDFVAYSGGLVGYQSGGTIINCNSSCSITVSSSSRVYPVCAGGLVGKIAFSATISNCSSSGSINTFGSDSSILSECSIAGGLVGKQENGIITNCSSVCSINASGTFHVTANAGGLVGDLMYGGIIHNCYYNGEVTAIASTSSSGHARAGGIVGYCESSTITNCYSNCSVSASGTFTGAGGIIGLNGYDCDMNSCCCTGQVSSVSSQSAGVGGLAGGMSTSIFANSYSTSSVTGSGSTVWVGGLVGYQDGYYSKIEKCYSTGLVTTTGDTVYSGGFIGYQADGSVTECFWDTITSGMSTTAGEGEIVGKITADMKIIETFTVAPASWDFLGEEDNGTDEIWRMCADGVDYPRLNWQYVKLGDFECPDGVNIEDLAVLCDDWLSSYSTPLYGADANGDQVVNIADFAILAVHWLNGI